MGHRNTGEVIGLEREIQVESYVNTAAGLTATESLGEAQREQLALWLKATYLNELFRGIGHVTPEEGR